jgi:hypothetical protein
MTSPCSAQHGYSAVLSGHGIHHHPCGLPQRPIASFPLATQLCSLATAFIITHADCHSVQLRVSHLLYFHSSCVPPARARTSSVMAADAEDAYDEIHPGATAGGQGRASSSAGVRVCPCTHTHTWRGGGRREVLPSVHFAAASTPLNSTRSQAPPPTPHPRLYTHEGSCQTRCAYRSDVAHTSASTTLDLRLRNGRLDIITLKLALLVSDVMQATM